MKHARHVLAAIALTLVCSAATSSACDQEKSTSAAAARSNKKGVSAAYANSSGGMCTADQMAACKAHGASAVTASSSGCASKASAVTASAGHAGCASKSATSAMAAGSSSCTAKGAGVSAMAAGSGGTCSGHGMMKAAGKSAHADCDACADMSACGEELSAAGAHTQVVPLKNGVMFVYTADSPGQITAVQSAMARRSERMTQFASAGEKARLCAECQSLRNAMSRGKLSREVVNIEGGALTLMTSDDPVVVAKIHAMVDSKSSARTKS